MENLIIKQDLRLSSECRRLQEDLRHAKRRAREQHDQAQNLLDKIRSEENLLDSLRRQRQRTGDDGFDIDISQKEDEINNLRRQVERAQEIAHEWEGQAGIIELQLIANDCGSFA